MTKDHLRHANIDKLMELLALKPGATVLDIGTGTGEFAERFAERVTPTGHVFATDIDAVCTARVAAEARQKGLANLVAVKVSENGVDDFYRQHRYDLVTLFHVYYYLDDRVAYLRKIRSYLAENGRVAILYNKKVFPFSATDFADFDGFIGELAREPEQSPFLKALSPATQTLLEQRTGDASSDRLRDAVLADLNALLTSRRFHEACFGDWNRKHGLSMTPEARDFANWLIMELREEGALDKAESELGPRETRALMKLNRLLIMQRFRPYFRISRGREYSPFLVGDVNRQTSELSIAREMREAGYEQAADHDLSTYYDLLVFAARK